jgi:hypothetical protein
MQNKNKKKEKKARSRGKLYRDVGRGAKKTEE